jgi:hypothetical protein
MKRRGTGKENKKCQRSGQEWQITMARETMIRHNLFLSVKCGFRASWM